MKRTRNPIDIRRMVKSKLLLALAVLFFQLYFEGFIPPCVEAVTEGDIRDAILGITEIDLNTMDINKDGKVDVADLVGATESARRGASFVRVNEGDGTVKVRLNFASQFAGTIAISVSGIAIEGTDYQTVTRSVAVNGTYAEIPITLIDDNLVEDVETIVLKLSYRDNTGSEAIPLGAPADYTVYIVDNDSLWGGTMENNGLALHFQMRIIRDARGTRAALVTDGYGIIPKNGENNEWPATDFSLGNNTFKATVASVTIPSNLTLTNVDLERRFIFDADSHQQENHFVDPDSEIRGTVNEIITSSETYLNRHIIGSFTLLKQIPKVVPVVPTLEPVR